LETRFAQIPKRTEKNGRLSIERGETDSDGKLGQFGYTEKVQFLHKRGALVVNSLGGSTHDSGHFFAVLAVGYQLKDLPFHAG
jgi:hypothetical protein